MSTNAGDMVDTNIGIGRSFCPPKISMMKFCQPNASWYIQSTEICRL